MHGKSRSAIGRGNPAARRPPAPGPSSASPLYSVSSALFCCVIDARGVRKISRAEHEHVDTGVVVRAKDQAEIRAAAAVRCERTTTPSCQVVFERFAPRRRRPQSLCDLARDGVDRECEADVDRKREAQFRQVSRNVRAGRKDVRTANNRIKSALCFSRDQRRFLPAFERFATMASYSRSISATRFGEPGWNVVPGVRESTIACAA